MVVSSSQGVRTAGGRLALQLILEESVFLKPQSWPQSVSAFCIERSGVTSLLQFPVRIAAQVYLRHSIRLDFDSRHRDLSINVEIQLLDRVESEDHGVVTFKDFLELSTATSRAIRDEAFVRRVRTLVLASAHFLGEG